VNNKKFKPASILLVEDDDIDAMSVQRAFQRMKIANPIVRAKDGVEALDILLKGRIEQPYLILLDLNMPRMGGLELLDTIRNNPQLESSVVFVLTTSKDDEDKIKAYKHHVAGYIVKEKLDEGFEQLVRMLDHYWRLVELPVV
jgi:CheY-like chemotaxis protein|tara:strand:- start:146 stop:574 length:429 start_codon:yes stop_codon:yes gene_type:complete